MAAAAPPPGGVVGVGVIDRDAVHQPGGDAEDAEKVPTVLPLHRLRLIEQSQVGFVDQCGGLQGLVGPTPAQVGPRQFIQFAINLRCELFERGRLAPSPGNQYLGDRGRFSHLLHSVTNPRSPLAVVLRSVRILWMGRQYTCHRPAMRTASNSRPSVKRARCVTERQQRNAVAHATLEEKPNQGSGRCLRGV